MGVCGGWIFGASLKLPLLEMQSLLHPRKQISLYGHRKHTAVAMSTEAPPTCCSNLVFPTGSQLEEGSLKGKGQWMN